MNAVDPLRPAPRSNAQAAVVWLLSLIFVAGVLVVTASYVSATTQIRSKGRAAFTSQCIGAVQSAQAAFDPVIGSTRFHGLCPDVQG